MKGDSESAAKHAHGVQVRETGVVGKPVTEERIAALEARVAALESISTASKIPFEVPAAEVVE